MTGLLLWRRLLLFGAILVAAALAVLTFAVHDAKARILQALGPRATVGRIELSYPRVTLHDVRIAADPTPGAWPSKDEFQAGLVEVRIDVASLWAFRHGEPLRISDVHVADGMLVMLRTPGHVTTLPALRETTATPAQAPRAPAAPPVTSLVVEHTRVERMAVDLYDATVPGAGPHRLRFEQVRGTVDDLALPALDQSIRIDMAGVLKGTERDGTMTIRGTLAPAARETIVDVRLDNADMIALQPWLLKFDPQPVRHGRLDLTLDVHVLHHELHAPGQLTLTKVEFGEGPGTFAGLERRALLAALEKDGRIELKFTLSGRSDDPTFALDEKIGRRLAAGLGKAAGVSVEGAVKGVGGVVKGLLGAARPASGSTR